MALLHFVEGFRMASSKSKKDGMKVSMSIEHLVSPDEFLKLLRNFVIMSESQLTDDECDRARQLIDQITGLTKTEQFASLRCLVVATGFLLQNFMEEVISKKKDDKRAKAFTMKFKETFQ
jgi:hypothetical protein